MSELTWEYLFKEGVEDLSKELNISEKFLISYIMRLKLMN